MKDSAFCDWRIDRLEAILPNEFDTLLQENYEHIRNTFPVTVAACPNLQKTAQFLALAAKKEKKHEGFHFYIRNNETDNLMGYVCIKNIVSRNEKCELAYFIDKKSKGRGIISAAVNDIIAICFSALQMNKIIICTSLANIASQRIALKNGFQKEGILRSEFKNGDGVFEDIVYFGLLKQDWNETEVL